MKVFLAGLLVLLTPLLLVANRLSAAIPRLPVQVDDGSGGTLFDQEDHHLEAQLAQALERYPAWQSLLKEEKLAVGVVDLSHPGAPRFAQINGNTMMYAASLAKIAILLAAFRCFEDDTLVETPEVRKDLRDMIRRSNNEAANRLIEHIGLGRIRSSLMDPRCRFYAPDLGGGIWLGKRFANHGEVIPDPVKGLVHAANVTQVCRFYYLLIQGKIISPERSRQMLEILSCPEIHDKFISVIGQSVPLEHLYRKSGTWRLWHADSVLVWDEVGGKYILVAMVENEDGEGILRQMVPIVQKLLNLKEASAIPLD